MVGAKKGKLIASIYGAEFSHQSLICCKTVYASKKNLPKSAHFWILKRMPIFVFSSVILDVAFS